MKKTVSFSIIALIGLVAIAATMKISDYPAKTYLTGAELFLLADGSTNAKMTATSLNAALTNVAGLRVGATIRTANGAALTNLTFTELLAANNNWNGSNYFPVVGFGIVTADSNVMNFASSYVTTDSASNLVATFNGSGWTNLNLAVRTNAINTGVFSFGAAGGNYTTNIAGAITLGDFSAVDVNNYEAMIIRVIPSGADRVVTMPANVHLVGKELTGTTGFTATNNMTLEVFVEHWGNKQTNAISLTIP